ncbi:hypothetical protein Golax_021633 [Gossypium laxum]|uniref:BHLH domain-containing protein n=1 Tax=Gossypium laxum TaxID=34288 RepID=A0A7J9ALN8_9ROSI|nr:hypothetical protein [Gossypium laxum]
MEKDQVFMGEGLNRAAAVQAGWNSCSFGMEMETDELNCVGSCFLNPKWHNSMDQSDPFESALSSMVCSPAASNAGSTNFPASGDNTMMTDLIGKLGNICNTGDISPQSLIKPPNNNNNCSSNTSCYTSPLDSPPKLNLSMMGGNQILKHPSLVPVSADPGFAERAARFSCFNGLNAQLGVTEAEFVQLTRVSTNQSIMVTGSQVHVPDSNKNTLQDGNSCSDKRNSRLSRCSSPENGDSKDESSISEQIPGVGSSIKAQNDANARKRKSMPRGKAKETPSPAAADAKIAEENDESTAKRSKQQNDSAKAENKENPKPPEPPKDYIHVRARRGQATDSHSLAERVRREKISERMKFLQDLVPGCNKVTGKALMLDEIINYVQSLQRQVEFLSMKLATVNPRTNANTEALLSKDMFRSRGSLPHSHYPMDSSALAFGLRYQPQQGLPMNNGISNDTQIQFSMNPANAALHKTQGLQLPPVDGISDANPQIGSFWDDDLQSIVQMGFGQNQPQSCQSKHS